MSSKVASTDCLTIDQDLMLQIKEKRVKGTVSAGNFDIIGPKNLSAWGAARDSGVITDGVDRR